MNQKKTNLLRERLLHGYNQELDYGGVSGERIADRLNEIATIGRTEDGGANRPGYSKEEVAAQNKVAMWMKNAGLEVKEDGAGNLIGRLEGKEATRPAIMSGSHVDSVPNGGHFDGVLGVIAALEVVEAWNTIGYQPTKPFEVVVFADEEGARFNGGLNGSEAMIGNFNMEEKKQLVDKEGYSFEEVLKQVQLSVEGYQNAKRDMNEIELFVEVHIEQGKQLEKEGLPCGVVTGIAGPCWLELTFLGEAGHAGNTPMKDRKDALVAASEFIYQVNKLPKEMNDTAVATIGKQLVEPNGVNVIPGKVTLYVDIRDIYQNTRDVLVDNVLNLAEAIADKHHLMFNYVEKTRVKPVPIMSDKQELLAETIEEMDMKPYKLPSGAGHDAMIIGEKVPVAMLFVQSKNGISHNPLEWSDLSDCVQTIHVLKNFVEKIQ
ncbi:MULTISPECIES: Zn-dependent hydrolase [Virgibacillus]|uniref:Zn-dependent hydrolase n=1 Tax=Virgibacillus salarius TaxID=447199 RepID=A0A941DYK5_9BACI|nr:MULTISPECIES: Zn-dependent hydrolase [Virgibacillus]MBR7797712.1 Zn-dependent hydrolase [Virgibacillus salarius]NAZ10422.1 hydantoinase/carbamoylase family amidase [Agaribacter marinus]WBX80555.1 Zn-dependent hydrolase [Virgibacillus salarius]